MQKLPFQTIVKSISLDKTKWDKFVVWLKQKNLKFSEWVRQKINEELGK